jgi:hypothetical protein
MPGPNRLIAKASLIAVIAGVWKGQMALLHLHFDYTGVSPHSGKTLMMWLWQCFKY